jgi:RNA 2',3'-cyclic 3'-phosphodiesterase
MNESPTCRTFVAIPIRAECLEKVVALQSRLDSRLSSRALKWTRREQLHLTLCFLGEVQIRRLDELAVRLQHACDDQRPFSLELTGIGAFPSFGKPNVIWLGFAGETARLSALQSRIAEACAGYGDHDEKGRAFHPHLTLARVKPAPMQELRRIGESLKRMQADPCGTFRVDHAELIRSDLSPRGSHYTTLAALQLKGLG